jgi:VIT1/CCC1 family predicted Fe2+/Mn2+ transporter
LGINFDARIVCGVIIFPFVIGNLHLKYGGEKRLSIGSILQLFFTVLIMLLLLFFMKKGHAPLSTLVTIAILFILILGWNRV